GTARPEWGRLSTASSLSCAIPGGMDFFKGTSTIQGMDGVSTNLALIFGTLLSSQGADASFGPVSGALRALPSFPTLSDPFGV
ncbi:hypothetical protein, partial [Streptomyces litmocidini]|uniref:hypothetical protein n=1 Tax=Streptomyces litmocidini TaxID=67318 RepID=UPI001E3173B1